MIRWNKWKRLRNDNDVFLNQLILDITYCKIDFRAMRWKSNYAYMFEVNGSQPFSYKFSEEDEDIVKQVFSLIKESDIFLEVPYHAPEVFLFVNLKRVKSIGLRKPWNDAANETIIEFYREGELKTIEWQIKKSEAAKILEKVTSSKYISPENRLRILLETSGN